MIRSPYTPYSIYLRGMIGLQGGRVIGFRGVGFRARGPGFGIWGVDLPGQFRVSGFGLGSRKQTFSEGSFQLAYFGIGYFPS